MTYEVVKRFWLSHLGKRSNGIVKKNLRKAEFYKWLAKVTINWKPDWIFRYAIVMQRTYSEACDPWLHTSQVAIDELDKMNHG